MSKELLPNQSIDPILEIPILKEVGPYGDSKRINSLIKRTKALVPPQIRQTLSTLRQAGPEALRLPGDKTLCFGDIYAHFHMTKRIEALRLNENYERALTQEFLIVMRDRKIRNLPTVFVDVGSAEGRYVVLGGQLADKTFAFEPDQSCFDALTRNISLNRLAEKISPSQCALDDRDGVKEFFIDTKTAFYAASLVQTSLQDSKIPVYTRSLASLCKAGMPIPHVIMIDVEGAEKGVLEGFVNLRPPDLFVEVHTSILHKFGTTRDEVLNLIKNMGYIAKMAVTRETELQVHYKLGN